MDLPTVLVVMMCALRCSGGGRGEKLERYIDMHVVKLCTLGVHQQYVSMHCQCRHKAEPNECCTVYFVATSNDCVRVNNIIPGCLATRLPSY